MLAPSYLNMSTSLMRSSFLQTIVSIKKTTKRVKKLLKPWDSHQRYQSSLRSLLTEIGISPLFQCRKALLEISWGLTRESPKKQMPLKSLNKLRSSQVLSLHINLPQWSTTQREIREMISWLVSSPIWRADETKISHLAFAEKRGNACPMTWNNTEEPSTT